MNATARGCLSLVMVLAAVEVQGAAVIVNEFNAVSSGNYLDESEYSRSEKSDPYFASIPGLPDGRIQGNGGNWIELVVVEDHVDLRGWELRWAEHGTTTSTLDIWVGNAMVDQGIITFGNAEVLSDLRAGTIVTIGELQFIPVDTTLLGVNRNFVIPEQADNTFEVTIDLSTDVSYDPVADDWWIHISTLDELDSAQPLATTVTNVPLDGPGNFSVGNDTWQMTILDASGAVVFGPVGEGIGMLSGVSSSDVGKLEENPAPTIDPLVSLFNDGTSSTFGAPNEWSGGMEKQDFSALRSSVVSPVLLQAGDADQDLDFDQLDLVRVQIAAKYLAGQPATWGEGDWNGAPGGSPGNPPAGDGQFNQADIVAALRANLYLAGPYAALRAGGKADDGQTSIRYDASSGEISVDAPAGQQLTSINIDSAADIFTAEPAQNLGGSFDNDSDGNIFKATFGSSFGSFSLGDVAPPGLSEQFLLRDLTVVGSRAGGGDLGPVDLVYVPVPEPATISLLTGAMLLVIGRVRRRRTLTDPKLSANSFHSSRHRKYS